METLIILSWIIGMLIFGTVTAIIAKKHGVEYLIGLFTGAVVITAVIANKLVTFGPFTVSASIIVFSLTFFLTDAISEFWGKEKAQKAVWIGFLADLLLLFAVYTATAWQPASFWTGQEAFVQILGSTGRITLASLLAYITAQNHDVWAYHFWKNKFNGKHLWIRNCFSTIVSQIIDSLIFATIAFYGVAPVIPVIISTIVVKFLIAILDTPFLYLTRYIFADTKVVGTSKQGFTK